MYVKIFFQRLLMELEEFAFQGCPDVRGPKDKQSPQRTLNNSEQVNVSLYIHVLLDFISLATSVSINCCSTWQVYQKNFNYCYLAQDL